MELKNFDWKESIYSDGSKHYISNPNPQLGETVSVRLRIFTASPVKTVILRYMLNGGDTYLPMNEEKRAGVFTYFHCALPIVQWETNYHFMLGTDQDTYYYNQLEVTDYAPVEEFDFRILAGFESPEWVKQAVFYQIFPDRFYNGNPDNDVGNDEYRFDGHPTLQKQWGDKVAEYSEAFCLDFYGGDLEGIKEKIPYLKELGVNALYLTPIFCAATHHKYDCVDYFNVDPHFGGNSALQALVEELHENGMKIILDVSINHTGIAHQWFNKDGLFFPETEGAYHNPEAAERHYYYFGEGDQYHAWFGVETLPTLNYSSEGLREIVYRAEDSLVKKWLKPPYRIDGWRFDVGFCTARMDDRQFHHEIWPGIRKSIKSVNGNAYIIAEHWTDNREFSRGDEWDASMNYFGFGRPVRQFAGETDEFLKRLAHHGITATKRRAESLAKMFQLHLAHLPYQIASLQYNLYDSHDLARLHNHPHITYESRRGVVLLQFTFPGTPSIYYGDEISLGGSIETAEGCRYPMEWDREKHDKDCFELHRTLARLKQEEEALQSGGFKILYANGYVIAYARFTEQKAYLAVSSQDTAWVQVKIPVALIGAVDDVEAKEVLGTGSVCAIQNGFLEVGLKPQQSLLFAIQL